MRNKITFDVKALPILRTKNLRKIVSPLSYHFEKMLTENVNCRKERQFKILRFILLKEYVLKYMLFREYYAAFSSTC